MANFFDDDDDDRNGSKSKRFHNAKRSTLINDDDDEEFWQSSSKFKPVFDDDDDDDFKSDFLEEDIVNWAGEPVSTSALSASSARYRKVEIPKKPSPRQKPPSAAQLEQEAKAEEARQQQVSSLLDSFTRASEPLGTKTSEAKTQADVNYWKRRTQAAESSRWTSLPVDDTIKRIVTGEVYSLETYKSLEEKLSLLDAAIQSRDGNALTAVVVFFQRSVKTNIFLTQIKSRPAAQNHYLQYLRQMSRIPELIEALGMFGLHEDAAILKLSQATKIKNADQKIKALKSCLVAHYQSDPSLSRDAAIIQQQIRLLEVQQPINQSDVETAAKAKQVVSQVKAQQQQQQGQKSSQTLADLGLSPDSEMFVRHPRPSTFVGLPLLTSLSYCCTYHFGKPASFFGSPDFYRKTFGFSEKQFAWVALRAHAKLGRWEEIEKMLKTKSWFGKEKKKIDLDFKKVAAILSKQGADQRVVASYLLEVDDVDERLAAALKIQCHLGVADAFASAKDRRGLEEYARKLKGEEGLHADLLLKNPNIKWKN